MAPPDYFYPHKSEQDDERGFQLLKIELRELPHGPLVIQEVVAYPLSDTDIIFKIAHGRYSPETWAKMRGESISALKFIPFHDPLINPEVFMHDYKLGLHKDTLSELRSALVTAKYRIVPN